MKFFYTRNLWLVFNVLQHISGNISPPINTVYDDNSWKRPVRRDEGHHFIRYSVADANLPPNQLNALWDLYNSTNGDAWKWYNITSNSQIWDFNVPDPNPCQDQWQGVTCICLVTTCNLVRLALPRHHLNGTLPDSIEEWDSLLFLDLSNNLLRGTIPEVIANWSLLQSLDVSENDFEGNLPSAIGDLKELNSLICSSNQFSGPIPSEIGKLAQLHQLDLGDNLFSGEIPSSIGNLSVLETLLLNDCYFTGSSIPTWIGNLTNLIELNFYSSHLLGPIPSSIGKLTQLQTLALGKNLISGQIPFSIGDLTNLLYLSLNDCHLSGSVPSSIGNLTKLSTFYFYHSHLTGSIPSSFFNLTNLSDVDFHQNQIFGPILDTIGNLQYLRNFIIYDNLLTGTLPFSISNITSLRNLQLGVNQFHGPIKAIKSLNQLITFEIINNFFTGECEDYFINDTHMTTFYLADNQLSGALPILPDSEILEAYVLNNNYFSRSIAQEFSTMKHLYFIGIGNNFLSGMIPSFLFNNFSLLSNLNMSTNLFTGTIPSNYSYRVSILSQLLIDTNFLTGNLPADFDMLHNLVILMLYNNQLTGTIPRVFQNFLYLKQLFLHSNQFEGSMKTLLNNTLPRTLENLDLSNNQFTGSLDPFYFLENKNLNTFAAVSNCLDGSIPQEICNATNLAALALDGLSTAEDCRIYFFPTMKKLLNGFYADFYIGGSIPLCLFSLPHVQSLHLSGNGLTGSLPSSLAISNSLTQLSLSHNILTGTIPSCIQEKSWLSLDLSYNKLTGTLSNSFADFPDSGTLSLEVNRLSGNIPNQLLGIETINILLGNLFSCTSSRELPNNDPTTAIYSCGSDSTNDVLYASVAVFGLLLSLRCLSYFISKRINEPPRTTSCTPPENEKGQIMVLNSLVTDADNITLLNNNNKSSFGDRFMKNIITSLATLKLWNDAYVQNAIQNPSSNLAILRQFFITVRRAFVAITLFSTFVLLTVYSVMKFFPNNTYRYEYVWSVSAVLLTGQTAALIIFFFLIGFNYFAYTMVIYFIHQPMKHSVDDSENSLKPVHYHDGKGEATNYNTLWFQVYFTYSIVAVLDIVLLTAINVVYVIIVINSDALVILFTTIALAGFKLILNNFILWIAIPVISKFFVFCCSRFFNSTADSFWLNSYDFTTNDITFLERLMIINNIILPILAIMIVLPDCFNHFLFAASDISSSYSYIRCKEYFIGGTVEYDCANTNEDTTYSPPFIYSYQCSSKVVIDYAAVYAIKFILIGFIRPVGIMILKYLYNNNYYYYQRGDRETSSIFRWLEYLLPNSLKEINPEKGKTIKPPRLFAKLSIITQLSSYLSIIVVMGGLFPPLAVIGCLSVITLTWFEELLIGRVLYESSQVIGCEWYKIKLEEDCRDLSKSLHFSVSFILFLSCFFSGYLVFDTWGDQLGWQSALPITCSMICFPLIMMFLSILFSLLKKLRKRN